MYREIALVCYFSIWKPFVANLNLVFNLHLGEAWQLQGCRVVHYTITGPNESPWVAFPIRLQGPVLLLVSIFS